MHNLFKHLVLLTLFLPTQNICGQSSYSGISSKDYYNFFNSIDQPDSIRQFYLESSADISHILKDTAMIFSDTSLFSPTDIEFIRTQLTERKNFTWERNKIKGAKVISTAKISKILNKGPVKGWATFNKKYGTGFETFSFPLFTADKNTCIVYQAILCGNLCGHGATNVYKKINGRWRFIQTTGSVWVS